MKITNAEVIKSGERELIDAITADLDWSAIEEIIIKEHNLGIEEDIEYKSGDIISCNNQIAYKLEFEIKANLSILLDRNGDYLSVAISGDKGGIEGPDQKGNETGTEAELESESTDNHSEKTDGYREALMDLDESPMPETSKMDRQEIPDESFDIETTNIESQAEEMIAKISEEQISSKDKV
jgi:hypothetical protein